MTLGYLLKMYQHYKNDYDFKLKQVSYRELDEKIAHDGEFMPD